MRKAVRCSTWNTAVGLPWLRTPCGAPCSWSRAPVRSGVVWSGSRDGSTRQQVAGGGACSTWNTNTSGVGTLLAAWAPSVDAGSAPAHHPWPRWTGCGPRNGCDDLAVKREADVLAPESGPRAHADEATDPCASQWVRARHGPLDEGRERRRWAGCSFSCLHLVNSLRSDTGRSACLREAQRVPRGTSRLAAPCASEHQRGWREAGLRCGGGAWWNAHQVPPCLESGGIRSREFARRRARCSAVIVPRGTSTMGNASLDSRAGGDAPERGVVGRAHGVMRWGPFGPPCSTWNTGPMEQGLQVLRPGARMLKQMPGDVDARESMTAGRC